ncbi:MAG: endolytic transglycosylase MltG [Actinomycetota bacterium]
MPDSPLDPLPASPPRRSGRAEGPRRRWAIVALVLAFVVLAGGVAAAAGYYSWCQGSADEHDTVTVQIPEGATGEQIVEVLHARGVVRCGGFLGRVLLNRTERASQVRAGEHELPTGITIEQAVRVLSKPQEPQRPTTDVTIPEGYTVAQTAEVVDEELGIPAAKFEAQASSGGFTLPPYLPERSDTVEGYLFPNTYEFFSKGAKPAEVIDTLLTQFDEQASALPWENADRLGVSPYEIVTIASMIEREAAVVSERPLVAAVIYNRLDRGMTLGIDATLRYIDPNPEDGLTASDLAIDSPYNTRLYKGLPPTPIASPGADALRAALEPAEEPFLYYVLCGEDGSHEFSVDYDTFLADKARCLG